MRTLVAGLVAATIAVTLGVAARRTAGDFWATLPGGYAQAMNPTLWDSPDLAESWAFHSNTYLHGPVQYLTLYPIVFLDSYRQIAAVLLPVYALVLGLAFREMLRTAALLAPGRAWTVHVLGVMFLFAPLLQAFVQREFEVVMVLAVALGLRWLLEDREGAAGAALAYVAWFKYVPLVFVGYFALRRWGRALVGFLLTSLAILAAAHRAFGLQNFFNNNVPGIASDTLALGPVNFCRAFIAVNHTQANIRHGLCRLQWQSGIPFASLLFWGLCAWVASSYMASHRRLSEHPPDAATERWRRAIEVSILVMIYSCFFFGHFYYLSILVVPFTVLLVRYCERWDPARLVGWGVAYFLLSEVLGAAWLHAYLTDGLMWRTYIQGGFSLYGELLLLWLLLSEYRRLGDSAEPAART